MRACNYLRIAVFTCNQSHGVEFNQSEIAAGTADAVVPILLATAGKNLAAKFSGNPTTVKNVADSFSLLGIEIVLEFAH